MTVAIAAAACTDCGRVSTSLYEEHEYLGRRSTIDGTGRYCSLCKSIPNWYRDPRFRAHFAPGWEPSAELGIVDLSLAAANAGLARTVQEYRRAALTEMNLPINLWEGKTVFVVGGGPSLASFDLNRLRRHTTILINSSALTCWGMGHTLFFMDETWACRHQPVIENWDGLVISTAAAAKLRWLRRIYLAECFRHPEFLVGEWPSIRDGRSSGHQAISAAVSLGAKTVVLLGFDMKHSADGRSHWHDDYGFVLPAKVFDEHFLPAFAGWNAAAHRAGVHIFNATPDSALDEFPKVSIDEFL